MPLPEQFVRLPGNFALRRRSMLLAFCGVLAGLLMWRLALGVIPIDPAAASMAVRMGAACAALLPCAAVLAAMILVQMGARFAAAVFDPMAGQETPFLRINQRVIANTVEQMTIFVPSLLALAAAVRASAMPGVLALAVVFALGRLAFAIGYHLSPFGRAPGMAASAVANLATLLAAIWFWLH